MTQTNQPTTTLTFGETARRLGEDVQTIRRWARAEQVPTVRDGRRIRIPAEWVAAELDRLGRA